MPIKQLAKMPIKQHEYKENNEYEGVRETT